MEGKVEKVDNDVVSFGYKFLGVGIHGTSDSGIVVASGTTVHECLQILHNKRLNDPTWNGVLWCTTDGRCEIVKNDRGHQSSSIWLHFRYKILLNLQIENG